VIVGLSVVHARVYAGSVIDDAFITFRHAWNLIHGQGFTCGPGARVEGTSSPLFALAMAVPIALGIAPQVAATFIATAAFAGCVLVAYGTVRTALPEPASRVLGLAAAAMVASSSTLAFHSQTGLETIPYACLLAIAIWLHLGCVKNGSASRRWAYVMGVAALVRPEGFAFFLCLWAFALVARRGKERAARLAARELAAFGWVWGSWLFFRLVYFGRWFPNSVLAKSGHVTSAIHSWSDAVALVLRGSGVEMLAGYVAEHTLGTAMLLGAVVFAGIRYPVAIAVTVTLGYAAVATWAAGDWMPHARMLSPCITPLAVATALGVRGFLYHREQQHHGRLYGHLDGHLASVVLTVALVGSIVAGTHRLPVQAERGLVKDVARMGEVGKRLASVRRSDDRVVSAMAGILPYYWGAQTLDIYGLCDPHIAEHGKVMPLGIGRFDPSYLVAQQPTFYAFEFSFLAADFYQLPVFAPHRAEYYMLQYPYGYLGSTAFEPPVLLVRKDRPEVERVAQALGARLVEVGPELRRMGFFKERSDTVPL
jgi:hypothetical protein